MTSDEKHIQEIIKISRENGKELTHEDASIELDRMRGIANILVDHVLKMSPKERTELEEKIKKEKLEKKLTRKSARGTKL